MKDLSIFSGKPGKALWVEAVQGLSNACARMHEIAAQTPGEYFVYSIGSRTILAQTETFEPEASKAKSA